MSKPSWKTHWKCGDCKNGKWIPNRYGWCPACAPEMTTGGNSQYILYEELMDVWCDLKIDERMVAIELMTRLLKGQEKYGALDLNGDKRDWLKERREEIEDLLIYTAFLSLKGKKKSRSVLKREVAMNTSSKRKGTFTFRDGKWVDNE